MSMPTVVDAVEWTAISHLHTAGAGQLYDRNMAVRRLVPGVASKKSAEGVEDPA
jgi:hypothetical protein